MKHFRNFVAGLASLVGTAMAANALAQDYPSKPIQLVVPYTAGGSADAIARALGPKLSEVLGQPILVDNRPGGGTLIGTRRVRAAPPDGYTVLVTASSIALNAFAYKNPGYKMNDFVPIAPIGTNPFLLIAHSGVPAKNVQQLVAHSKTNPGTLNIASIGAATVTNMCFERFKQFSQMSAVTINYPGGAPSTQALMAGTVQLNMAGIDAVPLANSPHLRFLAVTSGSRWPNLPDVPTFKEQGYPQMVCLNWQAAFVPARTPAPVIAKLRQAFNTALADKGVRERIQKIGLDLWADKPEAFEEYLRADIHNWEQDIQRMGLSLE